MYFIYALADPRTDEVAYIGITDNPYRRFKQHVSYDKSQGYKNEWIRQLQNEMLVPSLKILETVETEDIARERENYWIQQHKAQKIALTNTRHFRKVPLTERDLKTFQPETANNHMEKVSHIANKLRREILQGEYGRQGILPSRLQLAEQFQVTTDTINNVLSQLLAEGLLTTQGRTRLAVNTIMK